MNVGDLINRAYYHVEQREYKKALELLNQALKINESMAPAHNELCVIYTMLGRINDAYHHGMRAVELDPSEPKYHNSLSSALYDVGRFQEALNSAKTAISLDPTYSSAYMAVSHIFKALKTPEEDIREIERQGKELYLHSGSRGDGTPLRGNDLTNFFKLIDTSYIKTQTETEFDAHGLFWALKQICQNPDTFNRSNVVKESLCLPLIQWFFTIFIPIAGLFGYVQPAFSLEHRMSYISLGIILIVGAVIYYRYFTSPLVQKRHAMIGCPVNPHSIKSGSGLVKGFGLSFLVFGLGSSFNAIYSMFEVAMAFIGLMIVANVILRR